MHLILFVILTVLSHIGASLFSAQSRFNKTVTAVIWLFYSIIFLILPTKIPYVSYFLPLGLHFVLFFITTKGRLVEKGFLFISYATTYACFSTYFNMLDHIFPSVLLKCILVFVLMSVMQLVLYRLLLPSFRKVAIHILKGWGMFYAVVVSFWALITMQTLFTMRQPMSGQQIAIFILTTVAFCVVYSTIFNSMQNIVKLSQEKQKSLHTELLQAQVDAQAKEAELMRQSRHDLRFHYQALMTLAAAGDTEQIVNYLNHQSKSLEAITTGRFCENETINNTLKVFYQKAAEQNIAMEIRAAAKPNLSIPSPTLVSVLANILENALHGAVASKTAAPRITVSIKHKSGRLVISCENTCSKTLNFEEMPEFLQGIGIHSVISSAQMHNGSCRFTAADGLFRCTIIMDE